MKHLAAVTLARLRDCRRYSRPVPNQLLDDAIEALGRVESRQVAMDKRDQWIRAAAALTREATLGTQARRLTEEAASLARVWAHVVNQPLKEPPESVRDALHAARLLAPLPKSMRQYRRVLEAVDNREK